MIVPFRGQSHFPQRHIHRHHVAARLLLKPGRTYEQAVKRFSPYERIGEPYSEGRDGLRGLIERCLERRHALFVFVNNRFEGNAVETITEVTADLEDTGPLPPAS